MNWILAAGPASTFVVDLALVLGVAGVMSVLMRLTRQSTVVGYLLAGLVVGPYIPIPLFAEPERVQSLAEFGVILVMFGIGLEFRLRKFFEVLPTSGFTALVQMSVLFWCGLTLGQLWGWSMVESSFLGGAIAISSTMVVSKVFDQRDVEKRLKEFVLGTLVIQDLAAILLIAVMTGVASGQGLGAAAVALTVGKLAGVLVGLVVVGMLFVPRLVRAVVRFESGEILVVVIVGLCFATAILAQELGYSVALGAFVAGVLVAESGSEKIIEKLIKPLRDIFAAIFFVSIGMTVDPSMAIAVLPQSLLLVATVLVAQFVSVSFSGVLSGNGLKQSTSAGLALGQIGEFAFIIAGIGLAVGIVRPELQSILVTAAVMTAFTTPVLLGRAAAIHRFLSGVLPPRVLTLMDVYERWFAGWRGSVEAGDAFPSIKKAVRSIILDIGVILVLAVAMVMAHQRMPILFPEGSRMNEWALSAGMIGLWVLVSVPFARALAHNASALANRVSSLVVSTPEACERPAIPLLQRTYRIIVYLAVALAAGIPLSVVLQPVTGSVPLVLLVVGVGLSVALFVWRGCGDLEHGFRSGAERVARLLANQVPSSPVEGSSDSSPLPGFDLVFRVTVPAGSVAVGKSLTQLNVRAATGATVVAIRRGGSDLLLPNGKEAILAGDLLGIAGTREAIAQAESLFLTRDTHQLDEE